MQFLPDDFPQIRRKSVSVHKATGVCDGEDQGLVMEALEIFAPKSSTGYAVIDTLIVGKGLPHTVGENRTELH